MTRPRGSSGSSGAGSGPSYSSMLGFESQHCPFQKLGLPYGATRADVSRAFRRLAINLHPDKMMTDTESQPGRSFQEWVNIKDQALALAAPDLTPEELARTQAWAVERERRRRELIAKQERERAERARREREEAEKRERERAERERHMREDEARRLKEHIWLTKQADERARHAATVDAQPTARAKNQARGWSKWMSYMLYGENDDGKHEGGGEGGGEAEPSPSVYSFTGVEIIDKAEAAAAPPQEQQQQPPPHARFSEAKEEVRWLLGVAFGGAGHPASSHAAKAPARAEGGGDPWTCPARSAATIDDQRAAYLARKQRESMIDGLRQTR